MKICIKNELNKILLDYVLLIHKKICQIKSVVATVIIITIKNKKN